jgi:uncharacterized protein (TIGR03435 family)
MKKLTLFTFVARSAATLYAQDKDITGTWQGTLHAGRDLRTVLKISKADGGGLKGVFYSIDQGGQGIPVSSISLQGNTVKFAIAPIGGTYEGRLANTDGTSITGMWSQGAPPPSGPGPIALDLTLANDKTAWTIPEPPPPPTPMAKDAMPGFEVATIKPSDPNKPGRGIGLRGRNFSTLNTPLSFLIMFAYGVHVRQIKGGPAWLETDNYDIAGIPDEPGDPNDKQSRIMVQKLLADRFKLTFHREKEELTVFAVTLGKGDLKLTPGTADTNGVPNLGFKGLGALLARNATMMDFAELLRNVLDRPVVDQTGLTGRFDFALNWAPDETQFSGLGVKVAPPADNDARPNLFTAMQEQLGLKLESTKAPVDVIAIDHVEKPSPN